MGRSLKKGPYVHPKVLKKLKKAQDTGSRAPIKTWARSCTIIPEMVGTTFHVHNGKDFLPVFVVENMVGHKLGEFAHTRKFHGHGGRIAKEQAQAAAVSVKEQVQRAQETATPSKAKEK